MTCYICNKEIDKNNEAWGNMKDCEEWHVSCANKLIEDLINGRN